jgi:hypothetical protein
MRSARYAAGSLLVALMACSNSSEVAAGPASPEISATEFEARATTAGLELTNHGQVDVYHRARDPLSLALSGPIPCLAPTNCPRVPAQGRATVPFAEAIVGYRPDTERAIVYWWHFVPQRDGSFGADEVRTIEVIF